MRSVVRIDDLAPFEFPLAVAPRIPDSQQSMRLSFVFARVKLVIFLFMRYFNHINYRIRMAGQNSCIFSINNDVSLDLSLRRAPKINPQSPTPSYSPFFQYFPPI